MDFGKGLINKRSNNVRMSGFLEKKGKMKLMSGWKKYWFVLEERLLLYYRSEVEYTNLSPCRGSLNMGLVSTVCPGSSSGPYIIHVVTRTQVVQLRAKNRSTQEEWLQALLHSMSLPIVKKTIKPIPMINYIGSSLENVSFDDILKHTETEKEWTIPRIIDYRKRQMGGTLYGGSLDTAIWSKKCKPLRTPSPKFLRSNVLERILSFSKESDSFSLRAISRKQSRVSLNDEGEMKFLGKKNQIDEECEEKTSLKCKIHDENRNHDIYSVADKTKKKIKKTLSDTELNNRSTSQNFDYEKTDKKNDSPFERMRSVLSRTSKDKTPKTGPSNQKAEKKGRSNKRRRSFLHKVFRKKDYDSNLNESSDYDPLYYTIENVQEPRSLVSLSSSTNHKALTNETEENIDGNSSEVVKELFYSEAQKNIAGSKTILPAQAMRELKTRLKTRESLEKQHENLLENSEESVENLKEYFRRTAQNPSPPLLPPRRVSRPISPWHDVPTNNTPVNSDKKTFFVHHSLVEFHDSNDILKMELPKTKNKFYDDFQFTSFYKNQNEFKELQTDNTKKSDHLTELLEQLTEITVAPLAQTEVPPVNENYSYESQKFWKKCQNSDPDYDIPRPHNPVNIIISEGNEIIPSTEFLGRQDNSDTSLSFQSIEPDSLETTDKNHDGRRNV